MLDQKEVFNQLFEGLKIDKEDKKSLLEIYEIELMKCFLEAMLALKANDEVFLAELNGFFQKGFNSLGKRQKRVVLKVLNSQKEGIIKKMLVFCQSRLSDSKKQKLLTNLQNLSVRA